jgi:hypothetical protein
MENWLLAEQLWGIQTELGEDPPLCHSFWRRGAGLAPAQSGCSDPEDILLEHWLSRGEAQLPLRVHLSPSI